MFENIYYVRNFAEEIMCTTGKLYLKRRGYKLLCSNRTVFKKYMYYLQLLLLYLT